MALSALATEHGGFRLYRGAEQVGWAESGAVAFLGFASADEARRAAGAAHDALLAWLARQRRTTPIPGRRRALRTQHDGRRTRLALGGVPVGDVIRPDDTRSPGAGYGFELLLPPGLGPAAGLSAARAIESALARRDALRELACASAGV